jgi:hypothetical protein
MAADWRLRMNSPGRVTRGKPCAMASSEVLPPENRTASSITSLTPKYLAELLGMWRAAASARGQPT